MPPSDRPLSPHIQVYRPQMTSVLSIMHRLTGVALTAGTVLLTWWLVAAAYGPEQFDDVQAAIGSWFGQLILWGFTFAMFYHLANGIRHLGWDFGWGFEMRQLKASGAAMLLFAFFATLLTVAVAYGFGGRA